MAGKGISNSVQQALTHLKSVKPLDAWAVEQSSSLSGQVTVRLLRRRIPVSESFFLDLTLTADRCVAGVVNRSNSLGKVNAQVLVEANGIPVRFLRHVLIIQESPSGNTSTNGDRTLSDEEHKQLFRYAAIAIAVVVALKIIFQAMSVVYILVLPLAYLYAVQSCPSTESFDAKKELKRVLRGHHLPQDHPDKPKGFLGEMVSRAQAAVAAELVTFPGYKVEEMNFAGACIGVQVRVPSVNTEMYWVGIFGRWRYLFQLDINKDKSD